MHQAGLSLRGVWCKDYIGLYEVERVRTTVSRGHFQGFAGAIWGMFFFFFFFFFFLEMPVCKGQKGRLLPFSERIPL